MSDPVPHPKSQHGPTWKCPAGSLIYAIGDIHGCSSQLNEMIQLIEEDLTSNPHLRPTVVFLGDYVDRGPDSAGVLDILCNWRPRNVNIVRLLGNHEQAMLKFCNDPVQARAWLAHGGIETLVSYGVTPPLLGASREDLEKASAQLWGALPEAHKSLLSSLRLFYTAGDFLFAHAGVNPSKALNEQTEHDFLWSRKNFINSDAEFEFCVVHGHTPTADPIFDGRRIAIDTGAYVSGVLSAVRLEWDSFTFIRSGYSSLRLPGG